MKTLKIIDQNNYKRLRINIYKKFKKFLSVEFEIENETLSVDYMLSRLQTEANNRKIYRTEWPKNYVIFTILSIQEFKNHGIKILKTFEIILTESIEIRIEEHNKQKLTEIYHNDPILGGHCGQKRLYAKLKTKY